MSSSALPSDIVNNVLLPYLCKDSETETINRWMYEVANYCYEKGGYNKLKDLPEFIQDVTILAANAKLSEHSFIFYVIFVARSDIPFTIYERLSSKNNQAAIEGYVSIIRTRQLVETQREKNKQSQ